MNTAFYEEWKQKRVNKIVNIFGSDWFAFKNVLELGACYGDIGYEFIKLGSNVTFVEGRQSNINILKKRLNGKHIEPNVLCLDQNQPYSFNLKYDLVLHLGVLYHLENWQQDLTCAINHAKIMILETVVSTAKNQSAEPSIATTYGDDSKYTGLTERSVVPTQEEIEQHLINSNCKFVRLDTADLNTSWSWSDETQIRHVYDWKYRNIHMYTNPSFPKSILHYRRMWLILM